jgi:tetratricopeptide (TPR) repeat protein
MNHDDLNGVPLSTPHTIARDAYDRASTLFHGYYGDPLAAIDEALQAHPDFLMGQALKAGLILSTTDVRLYPMAAQTLDIAERHLGAGDERARGHLAAARAWHAGDWNRSAALYGQVLQSFPRDVLALQMAHLADFFMGRSADLRDRPAATLAHWRSSDPGQGFVLGMHAFGLEECGEYAAAESIGQKALQLNRRDPWAIHAVAHVHEMCGNLSDGIQWLETRRDDWQPDNAFSYHNAWHLALYWLELDQYDKVLALFDEQIRPRDNDVILELIDASAMLWRLHLRGVDVGQRWQPVVAQWLSRVDDRLYVFNDIHALVALLAGGQMEAARQLVASIESDGRGTGPQALLAQTAAVHVARGLLAFAEERFDDALPNLIRGHEIAADFGGSNAQRDLIALTALRCAERAGAAGVSSSLLQQRLDLRPNSPFVWSTLADWRSRHDDVGLARTARRQADNARSEWLRKLELAQSQVA